MYYDMFIGVLLVLLGMITITIVLKNYIEDRKTSLLRNGTLNFLILGMGLIGLGIHYINNGL